MEVMHTKSLEGFPMQVDQQCVSLIDANLGIQIVKWGGK